VVAAQAKASGPDGHYTAKFTLPSEGEWTISFTSPDLIMDGTATLSVARAIVAAPPAANTAAGIDLVPIALVLMLVLFGAIAVAAVTLRNREGARAAGAGRVTART
jgi:hypothetical protein